VSRRITWLILMVVAVLVAVSIMVYSRQTVNPARPIIRLAAKDQNPSTSSPTPEVAPDAPKVLCTLNTSQAPEVAGLRLGMPSSDVLKRFPGSEADPEVAPDLARAPVFGVVRFVVRPQKFETKADYSGINQITFTATDGLISDINVGYNGPQWKNVDEFVAKFSAGKSLPQAWEAAPGMDEQLKSLKCDGFEISVFAGGRGGNANYVQLRDMNADKIVKDRRQKAREKALKEGKP
jgi:hypothetical protein